LRLERVPPLRDVVPGFDRLDQRLHRLVARLVSEVAAGQPVRIVAQTVVDGLVDEQRVEHERARAQARFERGGDRFRRDASHLAVGRHQLRESLLEADRVSLEVDGDGGRELREQADPRAVGGERFVRQDAFLGLAQQVRPVAARRLEVVAAEREPRVGQQRRGLLVRHRCPLELDEDHLVVDRGAAFLGARHQGAGRGSAVSTANFRPA